MIAHGWYNIAFERDLSEPLTAAALGERRLVLARTAAGLRAFGADCPHRGAHLAYGGRLQGEAVICPFHGYKVGLGCRGESSFSVPEYPTLSVGGLLFVRLGEDQERGLGAFLSGLAAGHTIVPGFEMPVRVAAPLVIENAFDSRHFAAVHHIGTEPFRVERGADGELLLRSVFAFPATGWLKARDGSAHLRVDFTARAFSPGLIISQVGGDTPYTVITSATPQPDGSCVIRLSLAFPHAAYGPEPNPQFARYLLDQSRKGLTDDQLMWEHLLPGAPQRLTAHDGAVLAFQQFCDEFAPAAAVGAL